MSTRDGGGAGPGELITSLTRCYERMNGRHIQYNNETDTLEPIGVRVPTWRHAIAYLYGVTYLVETTRYDRLIRKRVMSAIGTDEWIKWQTLGVDATKSGIIELLKG